MVAIIERAVKECDWGVAHVFVDGAHSVKNGVGHRRQIFVEEMGELRRVETPMKMVVNDRMSQNSKVKIRRKPPSSRAPGISARRATTAGETNRPKAERISRS